MELKTIGEKLIDINNEVQILIIFYIFDIHYVGSLTFVSDLGTFYYVLNYPLLIFQYVSYFCNHLSFLYFTFIVIIFF